LFDENRQTTACRSNHTQRTLCNERILGNKRSSSLPKVNIDDVLVLNDYAFWKGLGYLGDL